MNLYLSKPKNVNSYIGKVSDAKANLNNVMDPQTKTYLCT